MIPFPPLYSKAWLGTGFLHLGSYAGGIQGRDYIHRCPAAADSFFLVFTHRLHLALGGVTALRMSHNWTICIGLRMSNAAGKIELFDCSTSEMK
jgi:hypothetical protein